jgi:hypothetical protein
MTGNVCAYLCVDLEGMFIGGDPEPGYYCPSNGGTCDIEGDVFFYPALPIPEGESRSRPANTGEYIYHAATKKLLFKGGKCGKGKCFKTEITVKELAKFDAEAAELVKTMQKDKRVASFSIFLKAQKMQS